MSAPPPAAPAATEPRVQEYKVRIPSRNKRKSFHIMKFNASMNVDPQKWKQGRKEETRQQFS